MAVRAPGRGSPDALARTDDRALAALSGQGNEAAFAELYARHHRGILSLARHTLGSREEAEDAVQHVFGVAFREIGAGRVPKHPRAWLYTTARNRCIDVLRARREVPAEDVEQATSGLSEQVERRADLRALVADIGRLPEEQRTALVLSELGDLDHAEVAEVVGCEQVKVRALVFQARSALSGWRAAREQTCQDVREELAVARGGDLRRGNLRRHLDLCDECSAFRQEVAEQRRRVALVLPVVPSAALGETVLGGLFAGGGAAAAGGGAAAAGGSFGAGALKIGAAVLVLGGAGLVLLGGLPGGSDSREQRPPGQQGATQTESAPAATSEGENSAQRGETETEKRFRADEREPTEPEEAEVGATSQGTPTTPPEPVPEQPAEEVPAEEAP